MQMVVSASILSRAMIRWLVATMYAKKWASRAGNPKAARAGTATVV
jgi:hypothetical protein